jgi:IS30 family transposase
MVVYRQLSSKNREEIYKGILVGKTLTAIAREIGRDKSTVSREVRRNRSSGLLYLPDTAAIKARSRRGKREFKINKYKELKQHIIDRLTHDKWSPEMIAARIKMDKGVIQISHESIYKFIYSIEGQHMKLYQSLMYRRPKRLLHHVRKHRLQLPAKYLISSRPKHINERSTFGNFEGDLTFCKGSSSTNFLVIIERLTRKSFVIKNANKRSIPTMNKVAKIIANTPSDSRKSITFDNGSEFKKFGLLDFINTDVYFCNPASPWQKGQVERLNAQLHKYIPKNSDIRLVSEAQVLDAQNKLNNLPRKILNFLTPNESWDIATANPVALQT